MGLQRPPWSARCGVVACAHSLTYLRVRSLTFSAPPCLGPPDLPILISNFVSLRAERLAERVGRFVEGLLQLVTEGPRLAELAQDVGALGLEEAVELRLELAHARGRDVVQLAGRRDVQDGDLLLDRERLVLRL